MKKHKCTTVKELLNLLKHYPKDAKVKMQHSVKFRMGDSIVYFMELRGIEENPFEANLVFGEEGEEDEEDDS